VKYLDEYRQRSSIHKLAAQVNDTVTRPWTIMEVCGGQTHAIVKYGLQQLLPAQLQLVHGPGCPVCVTSLEIIDKAIAIAARPEVVFCSFGDMLRVPGSNGDLQSAKAAGADVRAVYSPLHAVRLAEENPDREVVFFAIGFETTAPANAMAAFLARRKRLRNFSLLVSHFLVPPAIESIGSAADSRVQGFLAAGHVCAVMGYEEYLPLASKFRFPIVVTGFEPLDILEGILMCVRQLEQGKHEVQNQYARAVVRSGNMPARSMLEQVFEVATQDWRGVGSIGNSGLQLRSEFAEFDALKKFRPVIAVPETDSGCISGQIMLGHNKPSDCPHFGRECRPEHPLGAPMVSTEGACAAYHRYSRQVSTNEH